MSDNESTSSSEPFSCPICYQIPDCHIFKCKNSHLLCKNCLKNLKECPQCRAQFGSKPSRAVDLEQGLRKRKFECSNRDHGCSQVLTVKQIRKHTEQCNFQEKTILLCQLLGFNCSYVTRSRSLLEAINHLRSSHGVMSTKANELSVFLSELADVQLNKSSFWSPVIMELNARRLLVCAKVNGAQQTVSVICVNLTDDQSSSNSIHVRIPRHGQGNPPPLNWTVTCSSLEEAEEDIKAPLLQVHGVLLKDRYTSKKGDVTMSITCEWNGSVKKSRHGEVVTLRNSSVNAAPRFSDEVKMFNILGEEVAASCDYCKEFPIVGPRFNCMTCTDYDLCEVCFKAGKHKHHKFSRLWNVPPTQQGVFEMINSKGKILVVTCDGCGKSPVKNVYFNCLECLHELCKTCHDSRSHPHSHFTENRIDPKFVAFEPYGKKDPVDNVACNVCNMDPIKGIFYRCLQCPNYDLCENCRQSGKHQHHLFAQVRSDPERLAITKLACNPSYSSLYQPLLSEDVIVDGPLVCSECPSNDDEGLIMAVKVCRDCTDLYGVCIDCVEEDRIRTKCGQEGGHHLIKTKEYRLAEADPLSRRATGIRELLAMDVEEAESM